MPDNEITIRTKVEGLAETEAALGKIHDQLMGMNASAAGGGGSSLPSGAPATATRAPNPMAGFNTGPANVPPGGYGWANPILFPPGTPAFPSPGGGAPPPLGNGNPGAPIQVHIASVYGPIPMTGGGGATGGGGGSVPGNGAGSGAPLPPGGNTPPPPNPTPQTPDAFQSWSGQFGSNILSKLGVPPQLHAGILKSVSGVMSPSIGGATMSPKVGVGVGAALLAGSETATQFGLAATQGEYEAWKAPYSVDTQLMAARSGGNFISADLQRQMRDIAAMQSRFAEHNIGYNATLNGLGSVPIIGGTLRGYLEPFIKRDVFDPQQRALDIAQAHISDIGQRQILEAYGDTADHVAVDPFRSIRASLAGQVAGFGRVASDTLMSKNIYGSSPTPDLINTGVSMAMSMALDPRNAAMYAQAAKGGFADASFLSAAANQYAYQGDSGAIGQMKPALLQAGVSQSAIDAMQQFAAAMRDITNTVNVASASIGSASAKATVAGYGGTYADVAAAKAGELPGLQSVVDAKRQAWQTAISSGQPASVVAEAERQYNDALAQQAGEIQNINRIPVVAAQTRAAAGVSGAGAIAAGVRFSGGGLAAQMGAYALGTSAVTGPTGTLAGQLADVMWAEAGGTTKDEAFKMRMAYEQAKAEQTGERAQGGRQLFQSVTSQDIGVGASITGAGVAYAQRSMSPTAIYQATVANAQATYGANASMYSSLLMKGGVSTSDMTALMSGAMTPEAYSKSGKLNMPYDEFTTDLAGLKNAVTGLTTSMMDAANSAAAARTQIGALGQAAAASVASYTIQNLTPDFATSKSVIGATQAANWKQVGLIEQQRATELAQNPKPNDPAAVAAINAKYDAMSSAARGTALASETAMYSAPLPFATQMQGMQAQFGLQMANRVWMPQGNVRAAAYSDLAFTQKQADQIRQEKAANDQAIDADLQAGHIDAATAQGRKQQNTIEMTQRLMSNASQSAGDIDTLANGWQSRLINQTMNGTQRGSWVASMFTQRSSIPMLQNITGLMGFSGGAAGNAARKGWMMDFPDLMHSMVGMTGTSEGMTTTNMAGIHSPLMDAMRKGGALTPATSGSESTIVLQLVLPNGTPLGSVKVTKASDGTIAATAANASGVVQAAPNPGSK